MRAGLRAGFSPEHADGLAEDPPLELGQVWSLMLDLELVKAEKRGQD